MSSEECRKPIAPTLRAREVGTEEAFPIRQRVSLYNTISSRMDKERASGMSWTIRSDRNKGTVTVKRVS